MQQQSIEAAMREGAPISCATCKHFHDGNMFCGKRNCGGPIVGRDFPEYDGPIPREKFAERCLICGTGKVRYRIVSSPEHTNFSLCEKHKKVFDYVGAPEGMVEYPIKLVALP